MLNYKKRIVITGGTGRFGQVFKNKSSYFNFDFLFPSKKNLNILDVKSINKYLSRKKPKN